MCVCVRVCVYLCVYIHLPLYSDYIWSFGNRTKKNFQIKLISTYLSKRAF